MNKNPRSKGRDIKPQGNKQMKITREQKEKIISLFPKPRGNVKTGGGELFEALVCIRENGCAWRSLPASFGPWHTIYMRISRRAKNGVPERIYGRLKEEHIMNGPISAVSLIPPRQRSIPALPER
jgi:transposase